MRTDLPKTDYKRVINLLKEGNKYNKRPYTIMEIILRVDLSQSNIYKEIKSLKKRNMIKEINLEKYGVNIKMYQYNE